MIMNKREFTKKLIGCFLIIIILMVIGCGKNSDTSSAAAAPAVAMATFALLDLPAYTQDDLTGTWHVNMLKTGSSSGWMRAIVTADSTGVLTFSSCLDSDDNTKCPTGPIQWTIDANGVISETDNGTATDFHYTMTLNKNFIAGTGTNSSGGSQLSIFQKEEPGHLYDSSDMANSNFVYHSLWVGANNLWIYGSGAIDAGGVGIISSQTCPAGTGAPGISVTFTVESNGVVSLSGANMDNFKGFLSADNMTVVGTATNSEGVYSIWITQLNTREFDTPNLEGRNFNHTLTARDATAPFWAHQTIDIDSNGVMSFSDWVSSNVSVTGPTNTPTISIGLTGTATIAGSDFHGQLSDDQMFMIGTQTSDTGAYSLMVITRPTPLAPILL
jgi:hypothetical protein